jgi:3'(2'), 5'-bisphosphate nucleotidase
MSDLRPELDFALDLVRSCVPVALRYQRGGARILGIRHKPLGGGPVTQADREINDRIVTALRERFPDDAILAEESEDDGSWRTAERCWFVDPIDGTRVFARGEGGWTIQVGLCIDGEPVLGVVAEPAQQRITYGIDGSESFVVQRNGDATPRPLSLAAPRLDGLALIGGRMFPLSRQHAIRRALAVDTSRARSVGSVGARMTAVASGEADVYVQAPGRTKVWDTCAPNALLRAMGARVTDLRGRPLRYRARGITHPAGVVTSAHQIHDEVLRRLEPLANRWIDPQRDGA